MSDIRGGKLWHDPESYIPFQDDRGNEKTGAGMLMNA